MNTCEGFSLWRLLRGSEGGAQEGRTAAYGEAILVFADANGPTLIPLDWRTKFEGQLIEST